MNVVLMTCIMISFHLSIWRLSTTLCPHIISYKGRVIRQLEEVCGVFLTLQDLGDSMHEMFITGPRPACILDEFAIEMLGSGQHSVLTTLSSLRF